MKFAYEETGASVKNDKDMEKLNQMDTDGVNFRHQKQKEKQKQRLKDLQFEWHLQKVDEKNYQLYLLFVSKLIIVI